MTEESPASERHSATFPAFGAGHKKLIILCYSFTSVTLHPRVCFLQKTTPLCAVFQLEWGAQGAVWNPLCVGCPGWGGGHVCLAGWHPHHAVWGGESAGILSTRDAGSGGIRGQPSAHQLNWVPAEHCLKQVCLVKSRWYLWPVPTDVTNRSVLIPRLGPCQWRRQMARC